MNRKYKKIVIATGGTGGHVLPAFNLAKHFFDNKINVELICDRRGLKYLKNYKNIKVNLIPSSTIFKKNIFKSIVSLIIIFYSVIRSFLFLLFNRPEMVFGMGGYSSFPICIAAKALNIPFIIYENNLYIGKANKYLLPYTKNIFVSCKDLEGISLKYSKKVIEIGNIIQKEIINFKDQSNSIDDQKLKILILGGSQAAKKFAENLPKIFDQCIKNNVNLEIFQQCLPEQNEYLISFYKNLKIKFEIFNFSNNISNYFSKINLAITRSGSSVLAELINAKIPFISVPLPNSADDHQLKNAIYYTKKGYSYLVKEKDLSEELFNLLKKINRDKSLLKTIKSKQKEFSDKNVYKNIDNQMNKILNEKN